MFMDGMSVVSDGLAILGKGGVGWSRYGDRGFPLLATLEGQRDTFTRSKGASDPPS
jgi:hypothetical protein